jgi:hypothetical protein
MIYCFDLDHTLCHTPSTAGEPDYASATPMPDRIERVNSLKRQGHTILIDSARGAVTGRNWQEFTKAQLTAWGLEYDHVRTGIKLYADFYVDDRAWSDRDFFHALD